MKLLLCSLVFFFNLNAAWAFAEQKETTLQNGDSQFRMLYGEENRFFVDTFRVDAKGWQQRLEQKYFFTLKDAKNYFAASTRGYHEKSLLQAQRLSRPRNAVHVWDVVNQWNADWERLYTEWVAANLDEHFFEKYQIPTDCADVAFSMRWIFSRINALPAGVTLAGSERLFTQDDGHSSWASIPTSENWFEDERFRTALLYVLDNSFTHTLIGDSYPVEVSPIGIQPGGYHLTLRTESGHTRVINSTDPFGSATTAIHFVASDVPAIVRELHSEPFSLKKALTHETGGFLRFRWLRLQDDGSYTLVPEAEMPHYSLEQYSGDFVTAFYKTVLKHMGITNNPEEYLRLRLDLAWQKMNYRVPLVQKGFQVCSVEDCSPGTANDDNWGTPNRDGDLHDIVVELLSFIRENPDEPKLKTEFNKWRTRELNLDGSTKARFDDLLSIWYVRGYSSDPRDPILKRWGF